MMTREPANSLSASPADVATGETALILKSRLVPLLLVNEIVVTATLSYVMNFFISAVTPVLPTVYLAFAWLGALKR